MKLRLISEDEFGDLDDVDHFGDSMLNVDQYIDTPVDWSNKPYPSKNCRFKDLFEFGDVWVDQRLIAGDNVIALARNPSHGIRTPIIIVNGKILDDFSADELVELAGELDIGTYDDFEGLLEELKFEIIWEFGRREVK